jgi:hypothetical protein
MTGFKRKVKIAVLYQEWFYVPKRQIQENLTSFIPCNAIG